MFLPVPLPVPLPSTIRPLWSDDPVRLVHTADWHLGHALHDVPREREQRQFLGWLRELLAEVRADALVVAGDVFETSNPSAAAQAMWYELLADLRAALPALDVVVIGGNHDSASRLDAPEPLLRAQGIHVVGGLPRGAGGALDLDRLVVPLRAGGEVAAWMAAVPFLRPADLPRDPALLAGPTGDPLGDPLIRGVRAVYTEVLDAARARREDGQALLATGHCYMVGTSLSHLSERRILGGNQHALPVDIFPDDVAYAALGHLHKPQRVGGRDGVRYPGSPIPLAMNEARYPHQVLVVDLEREQLAAVEPRRVPTFVDMIRVPRTGAAPLEEILVALAALPERDDTGDPRDRPYLEVCAALPRPEPKLRTLVEAELEGKAARLLKLAVEYTGDGAALAESVPEVELRDLDPIEVFLRRYHRDHEEEPAEPLVAAFVELLDRVREERGL